MLSKVDAKIRAKEYLKQGRNATRTIKALEPNIKQNHATVKATRMLASVSFNNALKEELEAIGITDEYKDKRLKQLISQDKSPSTSLETIKYVDELTDRKPKTVTHLHLHKHLSDEELNNKLTQLTEQLKQLTTHQDTI